MRTAGIQDDDVVLVNRRGRLFEAVVAGREPDGRRITIRPLRPAVSYMSAGAREIVGHWRAHPRSSSGRVAVRLIRVGDVVKFRVGDCTAFGTVLANDGGGLSVRPLERTTRTQPVATTDVVCHYARRGRRAGRTG